MSEVFANDVLDETGAAGGAAGGSALSSFAGMLNPISVATQAISTMIGGITGFAAENQKAKLAQQAAQQARTIGGINTQEALLQANAATARGATLAAASGGGLGGTTAGVLNQIAERGMFNARAAAYRGASQAEVDEYTAKVDKDDAINSLISGFAGSAAQAAAGATTAGLRQSIEQSKAALQGDIDPYSLAALQ